MRCVDNLDSNPSYGLAHNLHGSKGQRISRNELQIDMMVNLSFTAQLQVNPGSSRLKTGLNCRRCGHLKRKGETATAQFAPNSSETRFLPVSFDLIERSLNKFGQILTHRSDSHEQFFDHVAS